MQLQGVFGMSEMEDAAKRIIELSGDSLGKQRVSINCMRTDSERTGFVELIHNGWMGHGTYNGEFYPNSSFLDRIKKGQ